MSQRSATVRLGPRFIGAGILAALGVAAVVRMWPTPDSPNEPPSAGDEFPIPSYSETRYLNAGANAHYIGTKACAECHRENHESYLLTAHSRSLSDVDPAAEPADASFHHAASGRDYRVYRRDGQLHHEEVVRDANGKEVARVDLPVKYLIGSGNFCRSYLVEVDGFLHESPMTWYTGKKKWDMSPGYDFPQHWSFERPINVGCVNCHSGQFDAAGSVNRMTIHEKAIGCERCHGPGSLHAERRRAGQKPTGAEDLTIVNPGRLSRPLLEAICAECHLNGPASVALRGRGPNDFRPGRPLSEFRTDYRFDSGSEQMTVVGHIEQLRRSPCYQKSGTLTCITCHDPHAREKPKDKIAFYRQKCLDCHASHGCSLPLEKRVEKESDNCVACHMPRGDTDIPHIAFTHHRIGIHVASAKTDTDRIPELVPTSDDGQIPLLDRQRNLGLAYYQAWQNPAYSRFATEYRERSMTSLEEVRAAGLREGITAQALAHLLWKQDWARTRTYSQEALAAADLTPESRAYSLLVLASCEFEDHNYKGAIARLQELVRLRRSAEDWRLLGVSYLLDNQPQQAIHALQQAIAIRPFRPDIYGAMYRAYLSIGDNRKADEFLKKANWLERNHQQ